MAQSCSLQVLPVANLWPRRWTNAVRISKWVKFETCLPLITSPSIASAQYDVSADGSRLLVITTGEAGSQPLTLVQNWMAEVKK